MEALPTAKRRAAGMGLHNAADTLGKRRRTQHFEDDGDDESDDEKETTNRKHNRPARGNIGYAAAEKKVMSDALENSVDGVKRYGDKTGRWEDKDEKLEAFNLKEELENGHFDEQGVYVEDKQVLLRNRQRHCTITTRLKLVTSQEQADPRDAWLDDFQERNNGKFAKQDEEVDDEVQRPLSGAEKIERQKELCALLNRGESVAHALKRLRKEKEEFGRLTDLASELLSCGFYNIYQTPKEDMQVLFSVPSQNEMGLSFL